MKNFLLLLSLVMLPWSVHAQNKFADQVYFGGGIGFNDSGVSILDDANGFQVFGGYQFPQQLGEFDVGIELGYMDSGDFDPAGSASGLWSTGLASYAINEKFNVLGRAGFDFGDDDGFMIGVGAGFELSDRFRLRGEYVSRDNVDSLQINVVFIPN